MSIKDDLLIGVEAEFVCTRGDGSIISLVDKGVLVQDDIVGADGHRETVELRTNPTTTVSGQLQELASGVAKYLAALQRGKLKPACKIRAGAWYDTPLAMHVHFSNFTAHSQVEQLLKCMDRVLLQGFLHKCIRPEELKERTRFRGNPSFENRIRVKGRDWWEWRDVYSCFTPAHTAVLLACCRTLAVLAHTDPVLLSHLASGNTRPSTLLARYSEEGQPTREEVKYLTLLPIYDRIMAKGVRDWNVDVAPLWTEE